MKVKYQYPCIEYIIGERELTSKQEELFKKNKFADIIELFAEEELEETISIDSALETGFAFIREIK